MYIQHGLRLLFLSYTHIYLKRVSVEQFNQYSNTKRTIITEEMDGSVFRWLKYNKLERYHWFFDFLSYKQIKKLNKKNIKLYIKKADGYICTEDQLRICRMSETLRERGWIIQSYIKVSLYK